MNLETLTNSQLYALLQNEKLDKSIRDLANEEMNRRKIPINELQEIVNQYDRNFTANTEEGLSNSMKVLLIFLPVFYQFGILIFSTHLANRQVKKWKEFWRFAIIGYLFWTIAIILYFRFARK